MKKIFGILIGTLCFVSLTGNVSAEAYYTNNYGVEMSEEEYNHMLEIYSERRTGYITQEEFDSLKDSEIVSRDVTYSKDIYVNGEYFVTEEVSEEEYENLDGSIQVYATGYVETSYKKLVATVSNIGSYHQLICALSWKQIPAYRSYDVFAFRLNHFNYSNFSGEQLYFIGSTAYRINYTTASEGYKSFSNGAGVSMNLKDGSNITGYELTIGARLTFNSYNYTQAHAYVSYQHAQANVSRAQSMNYTLDIAGYGNVVYFASGVAGYYDQMTGVQLDVPIV